MAGWPAWTAIPVAIIAAFVLLAWYAFTISDWPFTKKEWWQDREIRLRKERALAATKAKKR